MKPFNASVVQLAPSFFDKKKTVGRIGEHILRAAKAKSRLILFPEVIIPGYPRGLIFGTAVGGRIA